MSQNAGVGRKIDLKTIKNFEKGQQLTEERKNATICRFIICRCPPQLKMSQRDRLVGPSRTAVGLTGQLRY